MRAEALAGVAHRPYGSNALEMIVRVGAVLILLSFLITADRGPIRTYSSGAPCPLPLAPSAGANGEGGDPLCWALIGNDGQHLAQEYRAGIRYKLFELEWTDLASAPGGFDNTEYIAAKHSELDALRAAGFGVILSFGLQNSPRWIHDRYPNSYFVNQYGDRYVGGADGGDVNFVFNPELRVLAESYIRQVFAEFGTDFSAVRLGGGRYGELTYPPDTYNGKTNCYWSFDELAKAHSPTPNWRPGLAARRGEARPFLEWYLNRLVDFQNWQIVATRAAGYEGPLMMLYPSWGIRPGDLELAVRSELLGQTSAEQNGEIQRGFDFSRQVAAIRDPGVIVTTTWLDANASGDGQFNPRGWSPVKYLASLAAAHPLHLSVYGENTGEGTPAAMELSGAQMVAYGLVGMAWLDERELLSGRYATLEDYRQTINGYSPHP